MNYGQNTMDKINNEENKGGKTRVEDKFYVGRVVTVKGELWKKDRTFICERWTIKEYVTNITIGFRSV